MTNITETTLEHTTPERVVEWLAKRIPGGEL